MEFQTDRLIIRPWCDGDAESLYKYAKNPLVGPMAGWPVHTSVENSAEIIKNVLSADETYAVCLKRDNKAIGSIGLIPPAQEQEKVTDKEIEIGYWIGVPYWGQGLIPEAIKCLQKHTFEDLGYTAMWCGYYDGNEKSKRCQEKCGFTYHHTEYDKPCELMGDVRTEHFTRIEKSAWEKMQNKTAQFHLPGLFEFYEFYEAFLPLFYEHREYFYDWAKIGSIYGAPSDCLWSGGRIGLGENNAEEVLELLRKYNISARLTFSNSLLQEEHLSNKKCNRLCALFEKYNGIKNGVIVHSDLLLEYLKNKYPGLYCVSSTTKVITDFDEFNKELERSEFEYVVPDFRLNKQLEKLNNLSQNKKDKVEFLCNECCYFGCTDRKKCYENVSRKMLENDVPNHICKAPEAMEGYVFSKAMKNPGFISNQDIVNIYLPNGFTNFKIEGRGLGSALLLEFLLYYMTKPEFQLQVREAIYLDSDLDLF